MVDGVKLERALKQVDPLEQDQLITYIQKDSQRLQALSCLARLNLPDAWIAAGFVRNCVWDALHGYAPTPLNDIDVIYYDASDSNGILGQEAQAYLCAQASSWRWQVKNQALMHFRNQDRPYLNCEDAMTYWPEQETAVAVRLTAEEKLEILAPFGLSSLLAGQITYNPRRSLVFFRNRIESKGWLSQWPRLQVLS